MKYKILTKYRTKWLEIYKKFNSEGEAILWAVTNYKNSSNWRVEKVINTP